MAAEKKKTEKNQREKKTAEFLPLIILNTASLTAILIMDDPMIPMLVFMLGCILTNTILLLDLCKRIRHLEYENDLTPKLEHMGEEDTEHFTTV